MLDSNQVRAAFPHLARSAYLNTAPPDCPGQGREKPPPSSMTQARRKAWVEPWSGRRK